MPKSDRSGLRQEIARYEAVVAEYDGSSGVDARWRVGDALFSKALVLHGLGELDEEVECYDEMIKRLEDATDENLVVQRMFALYNKADALRDQGRVEKAFQILADLINGHSPDTPEYGVPVMVDALMLVGNQASEWNQPDVAVHMFDRVRLLYGDTSTPDGRRNSVIALHNAGEALKRARRFDAALDVYVSLIELSDGPDSESRVFRAGAMCNHAYCLEETLRMSPALAGYMAVLDSFRVGEHPKIDELLRDARAGRERLIT